MSTAHQANIPYPTYRDSGVDWLGEIPEHWEVTKIKFLATIQTGNTPSKKDNSLYSDEVGIPWVKPDDLDSFTEIFNSQEKLTKKGANLSNIVAKHSVLVCCIGSIGKLGIAGCELTTNQQINSITFLNLLNKNYGKYLIFASANEHQKLANKNVVSILSASTQKNIYLPVPPLPEQQRIAGFLDNKTALIEKAIALKSQHIALLKERLQIIIQTTVTQGLNKTTPLKNTGVDWLGKIPEHWEVVKLGLCLEDISIKNHPNLPLLSITREQGVIVRDTQDLDSNHNFIPDDLSNYKLLKKGQFGMNKMKAWQGSYGVSNFTGIVSPAYYVFNFIKNIDSDFFHWAIRCKIYIAFFGRASDGVRIGQWDLSKDRMKEIPFIIPPLPEQQQIADYLEQKSAETAQAIAVIERQLRLLQEYKTTLINASVTGKICLNPKEQS